MSETEAPPETVEVVTPEKPRKQRRIGFKHKIALLMILERKRFSDAVDYKSIAQKTSISCDSLRVLYSQYCKGNIDMGAPQTLAERQIDARKQHEELVEFSRRYVALLLNSGQGMLLGAEDATANGQPENWDKTGLPKITRELRVALAMKSDAEKGYLAAMEDLSASLRQPEKNVTLPVSETVKTQIVGANEEQRALAALGVFTEEAQQ